MKITVYSAFPYPIKITIVPEIRSHRGALENIDVNDPAPFYELSPPYCYFLKPRIITEYFLSKNIFLFGQ